MTALDFVILFGGLCGLGIVLSLLLADDRVPWIVAIVGSCCAASLIAAGVAGLGQVGSEDMPLWPAPLFSMLRLQVDGVSALLLLVTGGVALPVGVFSWGYLYKYRGHYSLRAFGVLYHGLLAAIAAVLVAGDVVSLLVGWEAMSVLAYLLVNFEHRREENTLAGYSMLATGEVGTLAAAVALLILSAHGGGFDFDALRAGGQQLGPAASWAVLLLSLFGFGVKAGLVPVNTWLPRAHPAAPANISALLSGVILNLGLYGIYRVNLDLAPASTIAEGLVVVVVGSVTALVGILYATIDDDMKRMLAHSSIENVGIITAGFGAALVFGTAHEPAIAGLALVAAFYHLVNHSTIKALLFLGAGSVDMRTGVRNMNHLGGLMRVMPWTATFFLVGAMAIAALPPLNGFVSEWLTLQTFLRSTILESTAARVTFVLCGAALALTAALAVTCFVKAFAMSFLGRPRSAAARTNAPSHPPSHPSGRVAMATLALACVALGVAPTYVIPRLDAAVNTGTENHAVEALVPAFFEPGAATPPMAPAFAAEFHDLGAEIGKGLLPGRGLVVLHRGGEANPVVFAMSTSYSAVVLLLLLGGLALTVRLGSRKRQITRRRVWAGGLSELAPEMTYTATGFSNPARVVFNGIFRPRVNETRQQTVVRHFRSAIHREWQAIHIAQRWVVDPVLRFLNRLARLAARMHSGRINAYMAYVLLALVVILLTRIMLG